jgi:hypothetical protein
VLPHFTNISENCARKKVRTRKVNKGEEVKFRDILFRMELDQVKFEQELVNNEICLPSHAEVNVSGKFLLFKSASANLVLHYSQYKKFTIETLSEIKSPAKE